MLPCWLAATGHGSLGIGWVRAAHAWAQQIVKWSWQKILCFCWCYTISCGASSPCKSHLVMSAHTRGMAALNCYMYFSFKEIGPDQCLCIGAPHWHLHVWTQHEKLAWNMEWALWASQSHGGGGALIKDKKELHLLYLQAVLQKLGQGKRARKCGRPGPRISMADKDSGLFTWKNGYERFGHSIQVAEDPTWNLHIMNPIKTHARSECEQLNEVLALYTTESSLPRPAIPTGILMNGQDLPHCTRFCPFLTNHFI